MFHDKVGVFRDKTGHAISFVGSANETWQAWNANGNHESFEVFESWTAEKPRVDAHIAYFESLWEGREPSVTTIDIPDAVRHRLIEAGTKEPHAMLNRIAGQPDRRRREPFPFQVEAIDCWEGRGRRGILQHATGTGKTVTALLAVRRWLNLGKPALILVPSRLLLRQWDKEIREELADLDPAVLLAGGDNQQWRQHSLLRIFTQPSGDRRITVSTIQTACTQDFRSRVIGGDHLLVVADEVHRLGAPEVGRALEIDADARLGMSATPDRYADPGGTAQIRAFFGATLEPVIDLKEAIRLGRLCPYRYFPHLVSLDDDEIAEWKAVTTQIVVAHAVCERRPNDREAYERYLQLLIRRSHIAKQAAEKPGITCVIVEEAFAEGQHWLVYCDDRSQRREVRDRLRQDGIPTLEYHSAMEGDAESTIDRFARDGGVLVAIKCLDEGVDIPSVSHAVILASSRNPREFIQRRGRVLRKSRGKRSATIHDLLVEPPGDGGHFFDSLTEGEIVRAVTFAKDAENRSAYTALMKLCAQWNVDIAALADLGVESDIGDEEEE